MGSGIYGIGVGALSTAQAGLVTTEHNIANANTDGYHRQQIVQSTQVPLFSGVGFFGQGVTVDNVKRIYSQYLDSQVRQTDTQSNQLNTYYTQMQQIDNMLGDSTAGLSPALQDFFQGANDVAANPSSIPSRQSMISGGQALVARFSALNDRLSQLRDGVNTQITSMVSEINSYAQQIAEMNHQIVLAESSAGNFKANDLHDKREQLVGELNKLIKANVVTQGDGSFNVFIGNGQALVVGQSATTLTTKPSTEDPANLDVYYKIGNSQVPIKSDLLQGGQLGGLLTFRSQSLNSAQNELGRIAIAVGQTFNDQQRLGADLNGTLGKDFFTVAQPKISTRSTNAGTGVVTASITDVRALTTSDYRLTSDGGANYTLTRLSDNAVLINNGALPQTVDGLTLNASGAPVAGDSFLIQPTVDGARDLKVALTNTEGVAAAAPMATATAAANTGTGAIDLGAVNPFNDKVTVTFTSPTTFDVVDNTNGATLASNMTYTAGNNIDYNGWRMQINGAPNTGDTFTVDNTVSTAGAGNGGTGTITAAAPIPPATQFGPDPNIASPVTITFNNPPTTFNVTGATTGSPTVNVAYTAGAPISFNGWTVKISGTPSAGDAFTVDSNSGGVADNRNALLLAGLQTKNTMVASSSGTATTSYLGAYGQMVSDVGNKTRELQVTSEAQTTLVAQVKQEQQSLSGVNMDEEAANLLRYQQAYQAAGKMIQVATKMFDTLLSLGS